MLFWLVLIGLAVVGLLYFYDIIPSKRVVPTRLEGFQFIYKDFRGSTSDIGTHFKDIIAHLPHTDLEQPKLKMAGCYFDDPKTAANSDYLRYALGFYVGSNEDKEAIWAELKNRGFNRVTLPTVNTLFTLYTYRNMLSYFLLPLFWARIRKEAEKLNLPIDEPHTAFEIYDIHDSKQILMYYVVGPEGRAFRFSKFPE